MKDDRLEPPEPWLTKPQLAEHLAVSDRSPLFAFTALPFVSFRGF